jgi:hypothetical protein
MSVAERPESPARQDGLAAWLRRHNGLAEFAVVGVCLLIYFVIRGGVVDEPSVAFVHAEDVIALERRLGIFVEPGWQKAILHSAWQVQWWNFVYFWWHAPVIAGVGFWLYFRRRRVYALIRNAFLVSCLTGLALYALYPVTPPRLMTRSGYAEYNVQPSPGASSDYGFEDTLKEHSSADYQAESLKLFVNPFAAMPSLHFGWAFLIGVGIALGVGARRWWGWALGLALTVFMFFGVVLTANHFILDAVVGFAVCLVGLVAAYGWAALPPSLHRRLTPPILREPAA